jgi:PAS domain S-box-containing protein
MDSGRGGGAVTPSSGGLPGAPHRSAFESAPTDSGRASSARRLARGGERNPALDRLAELAARLLGTGSAQVSVVADTQNVLGGAGVASHTVGSQGPVADSLCTVTVLQKATLVVTDATSDRRVATLPPVRSGLVGAYLGVPLVSADGQTIGALCVFEASPRAWTHNDIELLTELAPPVTAELELAALNADYEAERVMWQLAVDAADIGTFDWDLRTGQLRWDDRLLEVFGIDREAFGGTIDDFMAALHPDDVPRVTQALKEAIASCGDYAAEFRVRAADRAVRWVRARGRALGDEDGKAFRLLGAGFDTSDVREEESRVARVLESIPTAFFQLDPTWRFSYVNAESERLLGLPRHVLLGSSIWDLFPASRDSDFETHYRQAVHTGESVTFDAYYPPPLDAWYEVRAWPSPDGLSVYFIDVTARHQARDQLERTARRNALLGRVTGELTGTLEGEEAVARLASLMVPDLADWCVVTLVDDDGQGIWQRRLRDVGWWHADPAMRPIVNRYLQVRVSALTDESYVASALRSQAPVVIDGGAADAISKVLANDEARELCRMLEPSSAVVIPLQGRNRTVGLLTMFRGPRRESFSQDALSTLNDVAVRAGLALDNARLFAEQRDLAEGLQRSLLTPPPQPSELEIAVRYEPAAQAAQVGGDWYDAFLQHDGATVLVIGDVVGHDTAAAAAMGQVRGLLRGIAIHTGDGPAGVLRGVDQVIETLRTDITATAVVARLEQSDDQRDRRVANLRWSNAGHPPPLIVDAKGAVTVAETSEADLLLGFDPTTQRAETTLTLEAGATVLLYTDGLVERRGQSLGDGLSYLRQSLAELASDGPDLEQLCDRLLLRMLPERREDDVALVAVRLRLHGPEV